LDDALSQMREYGLVIDQPEIGRLKRCHVEGDRAGSNNGWYTLFETRTESGRTIIAGAYGTWKRPDDTQKIWFKGQGITKDERKQIQAKITEQAKLAEEARQQLAARAANKARSVWYKLAELGQSEYLKQKGVKAHRIRFGKNGAIAIPLLTVDEDFRGLQWIFPAGKDKPSKKIFWPTGVQVAGHSFVLGKIQRGKPIHFAEGYATAASIHEVLGVPVVVAFNSGNLFAVAKAYHEKYRDCPFVFCADDDWQSTDHADRPYNAGLKSAKEAADATHGYVVVPKFSDRRPGDVDFNDLRMKEGDEALKRCFKDLNAQPDSWKMGLARTSTGSYKPDTNNIHKILTNDAAWQGVIRYCNMSGKIFKVQPPPYPEGNFKHLTNEWRDDDTTRLDMWLSEYYGMSPRRAVINAAVDVVARDDSFHPIQDYLRGLKWDREVRLDTWLSTYLGAEISDYSMAVAVKWMVGAVKRVMAAPCKMDCVLILEGYQGLGKSTAMNILAGDWFLDTPIVIGDKDAYQQMQGKWIVELAELDSFNKADSNRAKSFFSSEKDRFRPAYGEQVIDLPRQCVFVGTTNQESYLKDATGNRRYWPVQCRRIDFDALRRDRDQLWAEAFQRYTQGVVSHVLPEEDHLFEREQSQRFMHDSWEDVIVDWLDEPERRTQLRFTIGEIFAGALQMLPGMWKPPEQNRVVQILTRLGFRKTRPWVQNENGKKVRQNMYERPEQPPESGGKSDG
jgi:putative DNA primase/helicase